MPSAQCSQKLLKQVVVEVLAEDAEVPQGEDAVVAVVASPVLLVERRS